MTAVGALVVFGMTRVRPLFELGIEIRLIPLRAVFVRMAWTTKCTFFSP